MADSIKVENKINIVNPNPTSNLDQLVEILKRQVALQERDSTSAGVSSSSSKKDADKASKVVIDSFIKKTTGALAPVFSTLEKSTSPAIKAWNKVGITVVASANLGIGAIKKVGKAYMEFASYAATTMLDSSRKMITSNSLFIDNATRDMMQQTGQTAVEAQSTQRALDRLGLSFDDLQSGKLTEAQAKAFEDVRNREISKLKELESVGTGAFDAIQSGQMQIMQLQQDVQDMMAIALAKAGPALEEVMDILSNAIDQIMPAVEALMPVVTEVFSLLPKIVEPLVPVVLALADALGNILPALIPIVESILVPLGGILQSVVPMLEKIIMSILPALSNILSAVMPLLDVVVNVFGFLAEVFDILMSVLNPIIEMLVKILIPIFEALSSMFAILTDVLVLIAPIIEMLAGVLMGMLMPILVGLQVVFEALAMGMQLLEPIISLVTSALSPLMSLFSEMLPLMDMFTGGMDMVKDAFNSVYDFIADIINKMLGWTGLNIPKSGETSQAPKLGTLNGTNYNNSATNNSTVNYNYGGKPTTSSSGLNTNGSEAIILNLGGY